MVARALLLLLLLIPAIGSSQGGQGGFGGGGAGGGFQGGQGGEFNVDSQEVRRNLFLSPGDRTEWTFEAKEHEAVFVRITSGVFDPAVAVEDDKGVKLAENDDIEPGDQMAQLVFAVPRAGNYKVVVTNYKGTAGGQFEFYARRFFAVPLAMGIPNRAGIGNDRAWVRIDIPTRGDYVISSRGGQPRPFSIMRPDGRPLTAGRLLNRDSTYGRSRFFAEQAGTYFIGNFGNPNAQVKVAPVEIRQAGLDSTNAMPLAEDQVVDWRIQLKANEVFEAAVPTAIANAVSLVPITTTHSDGKALYTQLNGSTRPYAAIAAHNDFRIAIMTFESKGDALKELSVRFTRISKALGATASSTLDWYEGEAWTFQAKPGDVVKIKTSSPTFFTHTRIVGPSGRASQAMSDQFDPAVKDTLEIEEPGQYVVWVEGGGTGSYTIERSVVEPKRLTLGEVKGHATEASPDVWRLTATAGQDLVMRLNAPGDGWEIRVVGPDGNVVAMLEPQEDVLRLKAAKAGDYTVIVTTTGAGGAYTMKWLDFGR